MTPPADALRYFRPDHAAALNGLYDGDPGTWFFALSAAADDLDSGPEEALRWLVLAKVRPFRWKRWEATVYQFAASIAGNRGRREWVRAIRRRERGDQYYLLTHLLPPDFDVWGSLPTFPDVAPALEWFVDQYLALPDWRRTGIWKAAKAAMGVKDPPPPEEFLFPRGEAPRFDTDFIHQCRRD